MVEELFAFCFRQDTQDLFLQLESDRARFDVFPFSGGLKFEAVGAAILFVRFSLNQTGGLHSFQQRRDGVGIAGDKLGELALGNPFVFEQGPQHGELVRGNTRMGNSAAKSLVQAVPGPAKQRWQTAAFRRIDRQRSRVG